MPDDPATEAMPTAFVASTRTRRVDVTGADRLRYLDDVTTQAVGDLEIGTLTGGLYLDTHGAPQAMFDVAVLADRVALLAPADEVVTTLVEVLGNRTFLLDARFTPTEDQILVLRGAGAHEVAEAANLATRPGTVRPAGNELMILGRDDGALDVVGPADAVAAMRDVLLDAGARPGGDADLAAWRVAAGVPAWGREVVAPHLPEEAGLLPTHVHLGKGCYPGQEAVARMWMLGRPRRRLASVHALDGSLEPGWQAGSGRKAVTATTVTDDGTHALAYVPSGTSVGEVFASEDGRRVEVVALVGDHPSPPGHDPAMTRRRDQRST